MNGEFEILNGLAMGLAYDDNISLNTKIPHHLVRQARRMVAEWNVFCFLFFFFTETSLPGIEDILGKFKNDYHCQWTKIISSTYS